MVSDEVKLLVIALTLYLFDCVLMLYHGERAFIRHPTHGWQSSGGIEGFLIMGRSAFVPNLLLPQRAVFRLDPSVVETGDENPNWDELPEILAPLASWVVLSGTALFIVLPVVLLSAAPHWLIFSDVAIIYGSLVFALVWVKRNAGRLQIQSFKFWHFAFEVIACPPFGVNMVRRLSLMASVHESVAHAEERLGVTGASEQSTVDDGNESVSNGSPAITSEPECSQHNDSSGASHWK